MFSFIKPTITNFIKNETLTGLLERLVYIRIKPKTILSINSSAGKKTRQLAKLFPEAKISQVPSLSEAEKLELTSPFDLIIADLLIQEASSLPVLFRKINQLTSPKGLFCFAMLGPDTLLEAREIITTQAGSLSNPFTDMHNIGDELIKCGFTDPVIEMEKLVVCYKKPSKLGLDLKTLLSDWFQFSLSEPLLQKILAAYQSYKNSENNLPITFEIIYGHAWSREVIPMDATEIQIPVDSLRRRLKRDV